MRGHTGNLAPMEWGIRTPGESILARSGFVFLCVTLVHVMIGSIFFNGVVKDPYMDEEFHVRQAQTYCKGDFDTWDEAITTLPGTYISSLVGAFVWALVSLKNPLAPAEGGVPTFCTLPYLRGSIWMYSAGCAAVAYWIVETRYRRRELRRKLQASSESAQNGSDDEDHGVMYAGLTTTLVCTIPTHFFLAHMYYTDVPALLWLLLSFALAPIGLTVAWERPLSSSRRANGADTTTTTTTSPPRESTQRSSRRRSSSTSRLRHRRGSASSTSTAASSVDGSGGIVLWRIDDDELLGAGQKGGKDTSAGAAQAVVPWSGFHLVPAWYAALPSVLAGFMAVLHRQTHVVWVAWIAGVIVFRHVARRVKNQSAVVLQGHPKYSSLYSGTSASDMEIRGVWRAMRASPLHMLWEAGAAILETGLVAWSYLVLLLIFAAFVVWNDGSIAVGHKQHHGAVFHPAHLGYALIALGMYWLAGLAVARAGRRWLVREVTGWFRWVGGGECQRRQWRHQTLWVPALEWSGGHGKSGGDVVVDGDARKRARGVAVWLRLLVVAAIVAGVTYSFLYGTHVHQFLLADNRHYTFYVYSKLIRGNTWMPLLAVPMCLAGGTLVTRSVAASAGSVAAFFWVLGMALTLVPAGLVEPRYWTPGIAMALVAGADDVLPPSSKFLLVVAMVVLNTLTISAFSWLPFVGADGAVARWMW